MRGHSLATGPTLLDVVVTEDAPFWQAQSPGHRHWGRSVGAPDPHAAPRPSAALERNRFAVEGDEASHLGVKDPVSGP